MKSRQGDAKRKAWEPPLPVVTVAANLIHFALALPVLALGRFPWSSVQMAKSCSRGRLAIPDRGSPRGGRLRGPDRAFWAG